MTAVLFLAPLFNKFFLILFSLYYVKVIDGECTGEDNVIILNNRCYIDSVDTKNRNKNPVVSRYNYEKQPKIYEILSDIKNITPVKDLKYHNFAVSKYEVFGMENTLSKIT
ncbi:MAG: hypothetical protein IKL09_05650 [Clostridia bacterium]|nr:hypothetical protein [Clostridia bacterium]